MIRMMRYFLGEDTFRKGLEVNEIIHLKVLNSQLSNTTFKIGCIAHMWLAPEYKICSFVYKMDTDLVIVIL